MDNTIKFTPSDFIWCGSCSYVCICTGWCCCFSHLKLTKMLVFLSGSDYKFTLGAFSGRKLLLIMLLTLLYVSLVSVYCWKSDQIQLISSNKILHILTSPITENKVLKNPGFSLPLLMRLICRRGWKKEWVSKNYFLNFT